MHSLRLQTFSVRTSTRNEMLDVTDRLEKVIRSTSLLEGMLIVYVPHTTAAVTINENADPDVKHDLVEKLRRLVPRDESYYRHAEGNSDSHLKTSLFGPGLTLIIDEGALVLGTWQGVFLAEWDGPRTRRVAVKVMAG